MRFDLRGSTLLGVPVQLMMDCGERSCLDCGERSCLSQFSSRFGLSILDEGGQIGDLWELSFAGDFIWVGGVVYVWAVALVGWLFYLVCFPNFFFICIDWFGWVWSSVECRFFGCSWNFGQSLGSSWINFSSRALYLLSWLIVSGLRATEA